MSDLASRLAAALSGRYIVERELGAGGMATVFLARDLKHDRQVAIKVLRPELASALGPHRFLREIQVVAQFQHPHILPLHDSGEADGFLYYVMPYVEGESLRDRVAREGALPVDEAVRFLRDVVDALSYAHRHGLVHRDVKPENVLLSDRHALVADFGIAKALSDAGAEQQLTTAGMSVGTPTYMSPEQAAGDPSVDYRADLYSFGVLAYEVLTGKPPFTGDTAQAIMAAHVTREPTPIGRMREGLPGPLAAAVMRCLVKQPDQRWQSADELLHELEALATPGGGLPSVGRGFAQSPRAWGFGAVAVVIVLVLAAWGWRTAQQAADLRWTREEAVPEIQRLIDRDEIFSAWQLARQVEERVPGDPAMQELWPRVAWRPTVRSDPAGASVRIRDYGSEGDWLSLGVTPLESVPVPRGYFGLRIEKQGYRSFDGASLFWRIADVYALDPLGAVSDEMVRVPGGEAELQLPGLDHLEPIALRSYLIGRHEVTNRDFKVFVDSAGYARPELWEHPFELNGRHLSFSEAIARFVDRTGRPGPATWEAGDYPEGRDDYPVAGVSWYEAAAYAKFAGMQLPTIYHWGRAAETVASSAIVPRSNFGGTGPAAVGTTTGMGPYGTLDMAGNVREWCANQTGAERYILGGGWNDPSYAFNDAYAQSPMDRSATNGFRLVQYDEDANLEMAARPIERLVRDFSKERPVPDQVFAIYRRLYDYDRTPLNVVVEEADSSGADWIRERIAFDAAYGERMFAYLFTPKRGTPPFQTVVYFPGSNAIHTRSSLNLSGVRVFDFILKSGRAVIHPIYKSTYERGDSLRSDYADASNFYKEHVIAWVKDFRRSIDYLETRADIDTTAFAYYGVSWGGYLGGLIPALEPRLKASVLYVAGLENQQGQPEVEPINYLPRITIPVLMLNGKYDHYFPEETSQRPFFELLGTPADRKRWVVYEGGHFVPRTQLITETLDWLDTYLGPVR